MVKPLRIGVVGAGWLGLPLVGHLARTGHYQLLATTRSQDKLTVIQEAGASPLRLELPLDLEKETSGPPVSPSIEELFGSDILIVTLPPGRSRPNTLQAYGTEIASLIQAAKRFDCGHIIYTSSTGVYGQATGRVDEQSPAQPTTESAQAVLAAEQAFQSSGIPTTILRLAGLYGPERNPGRWFQKRPIKNGDAPVNLVHQQDVIHAISLVIDQQAWNKVYNVCGEEHPPKGEYYRQAAQALGLAPPVVEPGGANGKWVDSSKIRKELGWESRN